MLPLMLISCFGGKIIGFGGYLVEKFLQKSTKQNSVNASFYCILVYLVDFFFTLGAKNKKMQKKYQLQESSPFLIVKIA